MPLPNVSGSVRLGIEFFFNGIDFKRLEDVSQEVKDQLVSQIIISLIDEKEMLTPKLTHQALRFMAIRMPYKHREEIIPFFRDVLNDVEEAVIGNAMPDGSSINELLYDDDIHEFNNLIEHLKGQFDFWEPTVADVEAIASIEDKSGVVISKQPASEKPKIWMTAFKAVAKSFELYEEYQGVSLDGPLLQAARFAYADATINQRFQEHSLRGVHGYYNATTTKAAEGQLKNLMERGVTLKEIDPIGHGVVYY